ncbi:hypothetical protein AVEN_194404-1 [Araneus ventricosus]|uniref:Uncharacterized protein n=1 Tax=Araneus ventricosus TaxID=182803 RepID=A0A4Y2A5T3_ARAVE|nr:hypothetical protein AVEN_194404-1 [Araneus ventricosus]
MRIRREPHEAMDPLCILHTMKVNGSSIKIWGCFNRSILRSATLCDNKMKSQHYLNVLKDQVIPLMDFFFLDGTGIFQDEQCEDPPSSNFSELVQGTRRLIFPHELATTKPRS